MDPIQSTSTNPTLTLCFIDQYNDDTHQVTICKNAFLKICADKKFEYFERMMEFHELGGANDDCINVTVPSVSAMKSIIDSTIDKYARARRLTDKIYCMDFIGLDTSRNFAKLLDSEVDTLIFNRIHQLIDQKGYRDKLHIKFVATKLPDNHDLSGFPRELLKQMLKIRSRNLLYFYGTKKVITYDFKQRVVVSEIKKGFPSGSGQYYSINSVYPIRATSSSQMVILYHLFTGQILISIPNPVDSNGIELGVTSICFAVEGDLLYIARPGLIEVYDVNKLEFVRSYSEDLRIPSEIVCSPNGKYLGLITMDANYNTNRKTLCVLDLLTEKMTIVLENANIDNLWFVAKSTIAFVDNNNDANVYVHECDYPSQPCVRAKVTIIPSGRDIPADSIITEPNGPNSKYKIYTPHQNIVVAKDPVTREYCGFMLGNSKSSFSYHGKYIYISDISSSYPCVISYEMCTDGKLIKRKSYRIDLDDNYFTYFSFRNIFYQDTEFAERIDQLLTTKKLNY